MNVTKAKILELIDERIGEMDNGTFLVEVVLQKNKQAIEVLIDNENRGVSIEDCMRISRNIEHNIEDDVAIEVSSPGADAPFKVEAQYRKNIGQKIELIDCEGQIFRGELVDFKDGKVTICLKNKTEQTFDEVKSVKRQLIFKK